MRRWVARRGAGRQVGAHGDEGRGGGEMSGQLPRDGTGMVRTTSGLEDACRAMSIVQEAHRSHAEGCRSELDF